MASALLTVHPEIRVNAPRGVAQVKCLFPGAGCHVGNHASVAVMNA
jgi:hypothetical protein